MTPIINLAAEREARNGPDRNCIRIDADGRALHLFALTYWLDERPMCLNLWAYDAVDAENRVAAMRETLVVAGQMVAREP